MSQYLTPKQIWEKTGISRDRLTYYRKNGYLKNYKQSPGTNKKGGCTMYDLKEVKEVFFSA